MSIGPSTMRAVVFDGKLRLMKDRPVPKPPSGWALIRVRQAGICGTDLEIMKGYMGFAGTLGHEFVGTVQQCDDRNWIGRRVVGEINAACGQCQWCAQDLGRHCPNRTTLGILNHDGCMADYFILPAGNLLEVPAEMSDDRAALIEPVSAACEMMEQMPFRGTERVVILGDGRFGILCAWALLTVVPDVTLVGHHPEKLRLAEWRGLKTTPDSARVPPGADVIIEATGAGSGMVEAMRLCRPRGTIVLKSTVAFEGDINLAPIVINEITIIGSRCGRFRDGIRMLKLNPDMPLERLITARYPIEQAEAAFSRAMQRDALKVFLEVSRE